MNADLRSAIIDASLLLFSAIIVYISYRDVERIGAKVGYKQPLYDVIHSLTPNLSRFEAIIDLFPIIIGIYTFYTMLKNKANISALIRSIAIIYILRAITTRVTILPSPICEKLKVVSAVGGCYDCIFSGHTALMLIFAYYIYKQNPKHKPYLIAYCILGSVFIIVTRSHYTIDVLVAWIVVYAIIMFMKNIEI